MTTFTPEDILLYLYKESSLELTKAIEEALEKDWTLREKMAVLMDAGNVLDRQVAKPRISSVANILAYAANVEQVTANH